jgi:hypothetical protein
MSFNPLANWIAWVIWVPCGPLQLTHQVPTGLFRPGIIGHFQKIFKYSKYGPIALIFFLKDPISINFHPPKRNQVHCKGRGRQLITNTTR